MTTSSRTGEHAAEHERNARFVMKEEYWYYTTREGVEIGPFDSRADAEVGASEFVDYICTSEPQIVDILKQYRAA